MTDLPTTRHIPGGFCPVAYMPALREPKNRDLLNFLRAVARVREQLPGALGASHLHCRGISAAFGFSYGNPFVWVFVWVRRALNGKKRRFSTRPAVYGKMLRGAAMLTPPNTTTVSTVPDGYSSHGR